MTVPPIIYSHRIAVEGWTREAFTDMVQHEAQFAGDMSLVRDDPTYVCYRARVERPGYNGHPTIITTHIYLYNPEVRSNA